jgi:hypothetical protein
VGTRVRRFRDRSPGGVLDLFPVQRDRGPAQRTRVVLATTSIMMDKDQVRIFWTTIYIGGSMLHWCRTFRGLTGDRRATGAGRRRAYVPGVTLGMSGKFVGDSHDADATEASERSPPGEVFRELRLVNALRRATVFSSRRAARTWFVGTCRADGVGVTRVSRRVASRRWRGN